jgi:large subunit ribosomal protein L35
MKTHKGLAKRIRITRTGKVLARKSGKGHLMSTKSGKRVRQLRGWQTVKGKAARIMKRYLAGAKGV